MSVVRAKHHDENVCCITHKFKLDFLLNLDNIFVFLTKGQHTSVGVPIVATKHQQCSRKSRFNWPHRRWSSIWSLNWDVEYTSSKCEQNKIKPINKISYKDILNNINKAPEDSQQIVYGKAPPLLTLLGKVRTNNGTV